eukprot:scaffold34630_cov31-Tisochrysis_lutea.AAC.1
MASEVKHGPHSEKYPCEAPCLQKAERRRSMTKSSVWADGCVRTPHGRKARPVTSSRTQRRVKRIAAAVGALVG